MREHWVGHFTDRLQSHSLQNLTDKKVDINAKQLLMTGQGGSSYAKRHQESRWVILCKKTPKVTEGHHMRRDTKSHRRSSYTKRHQESVRQKESVRKFTINSHFEVR